MVVGAIIPVLFWLPADATLAGLLMALTILLVFGAWDDSRDLDYRLKFLGQFAAVLVVVLVSDVKFSVFPFMGLDPVSDFLSIPVTVLFLVGTTNAVNLSDGLDGLAAGVSLLSLCSIALLAYFGNGDDIVLICFAVAGAVFGFLRYNTFPAKVFMGDTGSQFLGFVIGVLTIILTQKSNTALNPVIPLFLVGLPIIDMVFVMGKRLSEGRSPFAPDKSHIHHRILALGMKHYEAVGIIYVTQITYVVLGILLRFESDLLAFSAYIGVSAILLGVLLVAREREWNVKRSRVTYYMSRLNSSAVVQKYTLAVIQWVVVLYLVVGSAVVASVPVDLRVSALVLLIVLVTRLAGGNSLRFIPLRLLVFPTIAFAVYLMHNDARALYMMQLDFRAGLLLGLLILIFFAIRYAKDSVFQTTPTDLLVIALVSGVGVLYEQKIMDAELIPMAVGMVVLFYAAELVMRQMRSCWNVFTFGIVIVLVLLSSKMLG